MKRWLSHRACDKIYLKEKISMSSDWHFSFGRKVQTASVAICDCQCTARAQWHCICTQFWISYVLLTVQFFSFQCSWFQSLIIHTCINYHMILIATKIRANWDNPTIQSNARKLYSTILRIAAGGSAAAHSNSPPKLRYLPSLCNDTVWYAINECSSLVLSDI